MPRISKFDISDLPPQIADPTWERIAAHCPEQLIHIDALMRSFAAHGTMPRRYIEIAIVTVSRLNECRHCVGRHSVHLHNNGLDHQTTEQILEPDCPGLNDTDRLIRDYARDVSDNSTIIRDAIFDRLRAKFDEAQIVELTMRIGLSAFFNRFNNALQVNLDETHLSEYRNQNGCIKKLPPAPTNTNP